MFFILFLNSYNYNKFRYKLISSYIFYYYIHICEFKIRLIKILKLKLLIFYQIFKN
jgi:hypothetical protein